MCWHLMRSIYQRSQFDGLYNLGISNKTMLSEITFGMSALIFFGHSTVKIKRKNREKTQSKKSNDVKDIECTMLAQSKCK